MAVLIARTLLSQLSKEARRHFPQECVGLLLGLRSDGVSRVQEIFPLPNQSAEPDRRFFCHPLDYRRGEARAEQLGAEVCGYYHTHPNQPARPSGTDLAFAAFYDWSYLIGSVGTSDAVAWRSWLLRQDRRGFDEEPISIEGALDA